MRNLRLILCAGLALAFSPPGSLPVCAQSSAPANAPQPGLLLFKPSVVSDQLLAPTKPNEAKAKNARTTNVRSPEQLWWAAEMRQASKYRTNQWKAPAPRKERKHNPEKELTDNPPAKPRKANASGKEWRTDAPAKAQSTGTELLTRGQNTDRPAKQRKTETPVQSSTVLSDTTIGNNPANPANRKKTWRD